MKKTIRLVITTKEDNIETLQKATDMVFSALKAEHPDLTFEWEDCGYTDDVGGRHDSGVGWTPDGRYCGPCSYESCNGCKVWEWKQNYKTTADSKKFISSLTARINRSFKTGGITK